MIWKSVSMLSEIINRSIKRKYNGTVDQVLFYGNNDGDGQRSQQVGRSNLFCIYHVLIQADLTIDVCVPSPIGDSIAKCLIIARQKNIKVRVAIHNTRRNDFHNLQSFEQHGIEVKVIKTAKILEHEFILVDGCGKQPVAVVGSLHFETIVQSNNSNYTIISSDATLTRTLMKEFERNWNYKPLIPFKKTQKR